MTIYIIFFIIVFSFGALGLIKKQEYINRGLLICTFFLLFLFSAFRDEVGPDWFNYQGNLKVEIPLQHILNFSAVKYMLMEPLFLLLLWIVRFLNGDIHTLNIIVSAICIFLVAKRLKVINCFPLIGALIFMAHGYVLLLSQLRQGLAVCIFFYAIQYIQDKNLKAYTIWMLIAMGFHFSAAILFPLYFFIRMKFNNVKVFSLLIVAILFQQLHLISYILKILVGLTGNPLLSKYYTLYVTSGLFSGNAHITSLTIEWLGWVILLTIYKNRLIAYSRYFNIFYNICWVGLAIYIAFTDIYVFSRIALYFRVSFMILLPSFLFILNKVSFKLSFFLVLAAIIFIRWFTPIRTDRSGILTKPNSFIPYKTILF
jgi:hypothetical protein